MTKGNSLKWISLFVLIAQTTALVLTLRYSRTQETNGPKYLSSTAVLMAEIVKLITCILVLLHMNNWSFPRFLNELDADVFKKMKDTFKVGVPALLYVNLSNFKLKLFDNLPGSSK